MKKFNVSCGSRECSSNSDKFQQYIAANVSSRILVGLGHLIKWLCCTSSIVGLTLISLATVLGITCEFPPTGKAVVAVASLAAIIPVLLLLDGKAKLQIGLPCAIVATGIVFVMWQTHESLNVGVRIGDRITLQMREIATALHWYSDRWGHLPFPVQHAMANQSIDWHDQNGEGKPLYSWRVAVLPLPRAWNSSQPWDAESNRDLFKRFDLYSYRFDPDETTFRDTMVLAITGPGTAFGDGTVRPALMENVPPSTIILVEASASRIPWPAPGDLDIRTMPRSVDAAEGKGISGSFPNGFHVGFADKQVWFLSNKIPFETLERFFTIQGASSYDREELLRPYTLHRYP